MVKYARRQKIKVAMAAVPISRRYLQVMAYHGWHTDLLSHINIF